MFVLISKNPLNITILVNSSSCYKFYPRATIVRLVIFSFIEFLKASVLGGRVAWCLEKFEIRLNSASVKIEAELGNKFCWRLLQMDNRGLNSFLCSVYCIKSSVPGSWVAGWISCKYGLAHLNCSCSWSWSWAWQQEPSPKIYLEEML